LDKNDANSTDGNVAQLPEMQFHRSKGISLPNAPKSQSWFTNAFFLSPFFPFDKRLFFPTAMVGQVEDRLLLLTHLQVMHVCEIPRPNVFDFWQTYHMA
jgi:hypothetical protein